MFGDWLKLFFPGNQSSASVQSAHGSEGERLAADFLQRERGFKIIARNWRSPRDRRDEIDLVCRDEEVLVFVEVKARAADALVPGYHSAVSPRKKDAVRRACEDYLHGLSPDARPLTIRYDVVEIGLADGAKPEIRHFENVPLFAKHHGI